ncbi:branched-chain amino acid transport system II carrier protein [Metabacillus malikii]|uniref:Branched-chain amino acid transport system carrier protein n=1 Tax=Metabacillus malikii TaxID=1504265 RepID=A0ABT9ZHE6_9BACI|nr:branched-chain amino acid transport system II carrier protein [Metabacillus malikii]MDQ0231718.1 LIVCS family branched-chain amino acid:cation transporter [Metabacillus malikii]
MKRSDTLLIGLMLFSMFFGAGNLIFPPFLGAQSGTSFWAAMLGFIVTGVGLPFAVLYAVSLVKGGVQTIGNRVHPLFSTVFMIIVYLCIGPFLAIPRNANVAYEMGVEPFINGFSHPTFNLYIFTSIFFGLVYFVSLNPEKMERYMSKWITPILLISMIVLCVVGFVRLDTPLQSPTEAYATGAFSKGFIEGYNTMDALAALAFGIVILTSIQGRGITDRKDLTRYTLKAGLIAGGLLSLVYISLGLIGGKMAAVDTFKNGTAILSATSTLLLGTSGKTLLGIIFTLACFTTVVGLTTACGQYFSKLLKNVSYKMVVIIVTAIGFVLSNMGLEQILTFSVPFLVTAYPITIVLIILTFLNRFFRNSRIVYGITILFTAIFAIIGGLASTGLHLGYLQSVISYLPFASIGLEWIVPALVGLLIGLVVSRFKTTQQDL